jgi:hypothetical protein
VTKKDDALAKDQNGIDGAHWQEPAAFWLAIGDL